MSAAEFLKKLPTALNADVVADVEGTVQLMISTPTYLTLRNGHCTVTEGMTDSADVTITLSDDNLIKLLSGQLGAMVAFMTGKLQVDGDLMLAKQIPDCFDASKLA